MIEGLTGLGYGLIFLAILIGVGQVVLKNFEGAVANCATGFTYESNGTQTFATGNCCNSTIGTGMADTCNTGLSYQAGGENFSLASTPTQTMYTLKGYLGTSSGGLVTWILPIIAMVVGLYFIGALSSRGRKI